MTRQLAFLLLAFVLLWPSRGECTLIVREEKSTLRWVYGGPPPDLKILGGELGYGWGIEESYIEYKHFGREYFSAIHLGKTSFSFSGRIWKLFLPLLILLSLPCLIVLRRRRRHPKS